MRPNLQLALDMVSLEKALHITEITLPWIDWIEAGTPLVLSAGLTAVKCLKDQFPQKTVIADIKIMDAARLITTQAINANADVVTVLSASSDQTISACVETAHQHSARVLGDYISPQAPIDDCRRLIDLGVDYVGVHVPKDTGKTISLTSVEHLLAAINFPVVLAGGLTPSHLENMSGWPINTFVVGSAITNHPDPISAAQEFAVILNSWK